jgi:hypothetical protein
MATNGTALNKLRKDKKAVSPAISSVIITSSVVIMLLVTVAFANNFLNVRMAENEFSAVKQFMQTVGLQIDDVGWTMGRTQTIRYASRFGEVKFESGALKYSVYVNNNPTANFSSCTGFLFFSMPISKYNMGNGYHEKIFPSSDRSFLQKGTSAPVSQVFVIEKLPMLDGSYIRVVVAPSLRMLNSTITTDNATRNYYKFYLPILDPGDNPRRSQSVTLMGNAVNVQTVGNVNKVKIHVDFPKNQSGLGFDNSFFKFDHIDEEVNIPVGSIMEFYTAEVIVSLGLHA